MRNLFRSIAAVVVFLLVCAVASPGGVSRGPWSGGVTENSAVVIAKLAEPTREVWLEIESHPADGKPRRVAAQPGAPGDLAEVVRFAVDGLAPATRYHYRVRTGTAVHDGGAGDQGTFTTFPRAGEPASFRFVFASCAGTGSAHPVFTTIRELEPLFYLQTGDLHYENIAANSREAFRAAYDTVLGSPTQRALYAAVPIVYTWDDHDFGPNGSDRHSPSRLASLATYREYLPHYPLAWDEERQIVRDRRVDGPITQAFTVGRVRFLVLDCRSERDDAKARDGAGKTMLGAWQKDWLKRELAAANGKFPLIFIVSSVSWVSDETNKRDNWGRYASERAEIADWMVARGIRGVCFLSGDAHMLAADDGRHNNYAKHGGPNFPALQAAPLDRGGSIKGGPWSVAPVLPEKGEGQFGLVDVTDTGDRIDVLFRGLNHERREKLRLQFSVPAKSAQ